MNVMQRIVLISTAVLLAVLLLYPPFATSSGGDSGHVFFRVPPVERVYDKFSNPITWTPCRVDSFRLLAELAGGCAMGGVLCLAFRGEK